MACPAALALLSSAELTHGVRDPTVLAVAAWLDSKQDRSGSIHTREAYADTLLDARAALITVKVDFDGDPPVGALVLQVCAQWSEVAGRSMKAATVAQRLAIVSSFYDFALRRGLVPGPAAFIPAPLYESDCRLDTAS